MNLSTIAKIVLALLLAGFLWVVISNIQAPRQAAAPEASEGQLRPDLLSIAEDVTIIIGDVTIEARLQENYRNGEVHYQDFKMTQERDDRTLVITGKTAQTKTTESEIDFIIFERNVKVESDDGFRLQTEQLNYTRGRQRFFTNRPVRFRLNEISGRSNEFEYFTEDRLLRLKGNVDATYLLKSEAEGEADRKVIIRGQRVVYDQGNHTLLINNNARIAEAGSYITGTRIFANLTEDNSQFINLQVNKAESRAAPLDDEEESGGEEEQPEDEAERAGVANLSNHTSGIKRLEGNELWLDFTTGNDNRLKGVTATGAASMDITPRGSDLREPGAEYKKISGNQITALIDPDTGGIRTLNVLSRSSLSKLEQRPLNVPADQSNLRKYQPRTSEARSISMSIDPESNQLSSMQLKDNLKVIQGDLTVTANEAEYKADEESMELSGSPVFKDSSKEITADSMTISFDIDDLEANGNPVKCIFKKVEDSPGADNRSVFSISGASGATSIEAKELNLDYSNNMLYYTGAVMLKQGETHIQADHINIDQIKEILIAKGVSKAELGFSTKRKKAEPAGKDEGEKDSGRTSPVIKGGLLTINKSARYARINGSAETRLSGMTIKADIIQLDLNEEDQVVEIISNDNVFIDIANGPIIKGDDAGLDPQSNILEVTGRRVSFKNPGGLSGENYRRIVLNLETGNIDFYGPGNSPIDTRILKKESGTP